MTRIKIIQPRPGRNRVKNPSFESVSSGNPTDWTLTPGTSNAVALSATARYGRHGLAMSRGGASSPKAHQDIVCSSTSGFRYAGAWVYSADNGLSGLPPGSVRLRLSNIAFGGSSLFEATNTEMVNGWHYLTIAGNFPGSAATVRLELFLDDTGHTVVWDGIICEEEEEPGTYFDGTMPGCRWEGEIDRSYSLREFGPGGTIYALDDNHRLRWISGLGMPPMEQDGTEYGSGDGGFLSGMSARSRDFAIGLQLQSSGQINRPEDGNDRLHAERSKLIERFKPRRLPRTIPHSLVYRKQHNADIGGGTAVSDVWSEKWLDFYYQEGLTMDQMGGALTQDVAIRCKAYFPYFREDRDRYAEITPGTTIPNAYSLIMRKPDGTWAAINLGSVTRISGTGSVTRIYCIAVNPTNPNDIWLGGNFQTIGGVTSGGVVRYNLATNTFTALPQGGLNGVVYTITFNADGTTAYIGGSFSATGTGTAYRMVVRYLYASNTYALIGGGTGGGFWGTSGIYALYVGADGTLYAGGDGEGSAIINETGGRFHGLARFVSGLWQNFSTLQNCEVRCITETLDKQSLMIGLSNPADGSAHAVYQVNVSTGATSTMGGGLPISVKTIITDPATGDIYAGGTFFGNVAGSPPTYRGVARWNGLSWFPLNAGVSASTDVRALIIDAEGSLVAGGAFTQVNGAVSADAVSDGVARWDGFMWRGYDFQVGNRQVDSLATNSLGYLFVGYGDTGTATVYSGVNTPLRYDGTAPCYPTLRVVGPGTLKRLRNATTGQEIEFSYTLVANEILEIVFNPEYFKATSNFYGDVAGRIFARGSSSVFQLDNAKPFVVNGVNGANNIIYTFMTGTTSDTKAYLFWQNHFYSADD